MTVLVTRGLGRNGGLLATSGLGRILLDEQVKGGKARKHRRRIIHIGREPFELSDLSVITTPEVESLIKTGKAEVNGTEVTVENIPTPPEPTIDESAPPLKDIKDELDREIAELLRIQEHKLFEKRVLIFIEELISFEEEFLLFLILMDEC